MAVININTIIVDCNVSQTMKWTDVLTKDFAQEKRLDQVELCV